MAQDHHARTPCHLEEHQASFRDPDVVHGNPKEEFRIQSTPLGRR
jgi:hypothetical protein